jgi:methylmalonyl-CoA mutase N-terminal domain/subunit
LSRLEKVRRDRDDDVVRAALARLSREASDPEVNLMPALIDAAKSYATVGEMMAALAEVFGRYVEVPTL